MSVSRQERVSHVVRRLSMGSHPALVAGLADPDAAIARALDLSVPAPAVPLGLPPASYDTQRPVDIVPTILWWVDQMRSNQHLIAERLVWFWHDHFSTSLAKVRVPYLMAQQHATIRAHATGGFDQLVRAIATDPAMLLYLDAPTNTVDAVNENFGRECLELFTMGIGGGYSQADVVEASRAFSGWVVHVPGRRFAPRLARAGVAPWASVLVPARHDAGTKTLLGVEGPLDLDRALEIVLEHPATGRHVAGKLYRELVGVDPDEATQIRLGDAFAQDWSILGLVEDIVADERFLADAAVRSRVRTPVEKLVGVLQAGAAPPLQARADDVARGAGGIGEALRAVGFIPFVPPNVGGFTSGPSLLGPHQLVHTFDLLQVFDEAPSVPNDVDALFAQFGLFDVSEATRRTIESETDRGRRFALVAASPEYAVT
jgi:uncharacterized protein (DUF1800 family)